MDNPIRRRHLAGQVMPEIVLVGVDRVRDVRGRPWAWFLQEVDAYGSR